MLSYQHGYHAGNFADVFKHSILTRILKYLLMKDKPFVYIETHSGSGLYNLNSAKSIKTGEAKLGVEVLWKNRNISPIVLHDYIKLLSSLNKDLIKIYPGSPWFAKNMLRDSDRIFCAELHPQEFLNLKKILSVRKNTKCENVDGLQALKALLPPHERRGLIFIDPSYEVKHDYIAIPKILADAYKRFATGIYCVWYPILEKNYHIDYLEKLNAIGFKDTINLDFKIDNIHKGMHGCGLWVANAPYILQEEAYNIRNYLHSIWV